MKYITRENNHIYTIPVLKQTLLHLHAVEPYIRRYKRQDKYYKTFAMVLLHAEVNNNSNFNWDLYIGKYMRN